MVQTIEELEAENARNNASIDALKLGLNELAAIAKNAQTASRNWKLRTRGWLSKEPPLPPASEMEASIKWVDSATLPASSGRRGYRDHVGGVQRHCSAPLASRWTRDRRSRGPGRA